MRYLPVVFALLAWPAMAQDLATGAKIKSALSGNTVQGSMQTSGAYTEFYAADGTIKGADYIGSWSIKGDQLCFVYNDSPELCWGVRIAGRQITWVGADGDEGTGNLLGGNPNGF